jgi:hypothetical protein
MNAIKTMPSVTFHRVKRIANYEISAFAFCFYLFITLSPGDSRRSAMLLIKTRSKFSPLSLSLKWSRRRKKGEEMNTLNGSRASHREEAESLRMTAA